VGLTLREIRDPFVEGETSGSGKNILSEACLVTIHNVSAAEAIVLGMKAGLDPAVIYDTLADSAGSSRMFQVRDPQMRDNHYDNPTATIRTYLKDLSVINASRPTSTAPRRSFLRRRSSITQGLHRDARCRAQRWSARSWKRWPE
jgi:3-hydroxyisobutyrate dehydrogenase-like beta-hydroxyacid dehydrogenase